MKKVGCRISLLVLMCMFVFCGSVLAQGFSADIVSTVDNQVMKGKIFVSHYKMRFETEEMVNITRMDKKVVWILMPSEKMYMEQPLRVSNVIPSKEPVQDNEERVYIGTEDVSGKIADKYRVTVTSSAQKDSYYLWLDKEHGFPVKMAALDGKWSNEYKNVTFDEPNASLFEIPSGYQKMTMTF